MRHILSLALSPPTLQPTGSGGKKAAQHRVQKQQATNTKLTFLDYWNKPDVRGVLYAQHGEVCAYCGCDLPRNDRGDVEHYRPKGNLAENPNHGGYWWLAYHLRNYVLSCSLCNRARKKDRFPMRRRARHVTFEKRHRLRREARLLLDPQVDPVEDWLVVEWRKPVCRIQPSAHLTAVQQQQVEETLRFFRINLDPRLLKERMAIRDDTLALLKPQLRQQDAQKLKQTAMRCAPHSLVVQQILADQAPNLLPTPNEERFWQVQHWAQNLALTLSLLAQTPDDILRKQAEELAWSLAALLKVSVRENDLLVQAYLTQLGMLDEIQARSLML